MAGEKDKKLEQTRNAEAVKDNTIRTAESEPLPAAGGAGEIAEGLTGEAPAAKGPRKGLTKPKKRPLYKRPAFYVLIAVALALVIGGAAVANNVRTAIQASASPAANTVALEKRTLVSDILTSGTVKSKNVNKVYAPSSLKIKSVLMDVGDMVKPGDQLATLDTYQLEQDIKTTELNIANLEHGLTTEDLSLSNGTKSAKTSVSSAKIQVDQAQRDYDKLTGQDGGSPVRNAEIAVEEARKAYEDALNPETAQRNAQLDMASAQSRYDQAMRARNDAYSSLQTAQSNLNSATDATRAQAQSAVDSAQKGVTSAEGTARDAQIALEKARVAYESAQTNISDTLTAKKDALEKAQMSYEDAVRSSDDNIKLAAEKLKNAKLTYQNAMDSLSLAKSKDSMSTQTNIELQKLSLQSKQKQLREATLSAPEAGMVTYVNATEGAMASGLMFVIEDVNTLMVAVTVGEYDIDSVALGQKVVITTDFTGSEEFAGEVTFISPTAQKSAAGETQETNSVKFDVEITIRQADPRLKIGMNATASIITKEKEDALAAPFDAVYDNNGAKYIVVLNEDGSMKEIPVTVGIETDAYTEVIGDGLSEGMRVVVNYDQNAAGQGARTSGGPFRMQAGGGPGQ